MMLMKPSNNRRPKRKHLLLILTGVMAWLLGSGLFAILMAPYWIPILATEAARWFGVHLKFEIEHMSHRGGTLQNLAVEIPQASITADQVILVASPRDWLAGRLDSVMVQNGRVLIHLGDLMEGESEETPESPTRSIDNWIKNGLGDLPIRSVLLPDLEIELTGNEGSLMIELDASALLQDESLHLAIHGRSGSATFHLLDSVRVEGGRVVEFILQLPDPKSWFEDLSSFISPLIPMQPASVPLTEAGPMSMRLAWSEEEDRIELGGNWTNVVLTNGIGITDLFIQAHSDDWLSTVFVNIGVDPIAMPGTGNISLKVKSLLHEPFTEERRVEIEFSTSSFKPSENDGEESMFDPMQGSLAFGPGLQGTITLPSLSSPLSPVALMKNLGSFDFAGDRWQATWTAGIEGAQEGLRIAVDGEPAGIFLEASGSISNDTALRIPELELTIRPHLISYRNEEVTLSATAETSLSILASGDPDLIPFSGMISLKATEIRWEALQSDQASMKLQLKHHGIRWLPGSEMPSLTAMLPGLQSTLEVNFSGFLADQPFTLRGIRAVKEPGDLPVSLSADQISWMQIQINTATGYLAEKEAGMEITLDGHSLGETLHLGVEAFIPNEQHPEGTEFRFFLKTPEAVARSEFPVHTLTGTDSISWVMGVLDLQGTWLQSNESSDLEIQGSLKQGTWSMPDSGISAQGIEIAAFSIHNMLTTPKGEAIEITAAEVFFPPAQIRDLELQLKLLPDQSVEILHCQFSLAQGKFTLNFPEPIQAPYDTTKVIVQFSEVELLEIIQMFPDFQDHIEGIIEGHITIILKQGTLAWEPGFAKLMPGKSGKLIMADQGFLAPHIPPIVIDPTTNTDIRTALKEISLSEITLNLQASSHFEAPSVLTLSGRSLDPRISVPIERIQFNIRAPDLPDLINQGINWKHGMPSFNMKP